MTDPRTTRRFEWRVFALTSAFALVSLGCVSVSAPSHADPIPPSPIPGYELAWNDEFEGTALDESAWYHRVNLHSKCSNKAENVSVSDGLLRIALKQEDDRGVSFTCGGTITKKWFGYGYYEIRAKLWGDTGWHSSFWTAGLSAQMTEVDGYNGPHNFVNEIDGFEIDSSHPDEISHNLHWWTPPDDAHISGGGAGPDSSADYHVYGFEWTPTQVLFYVDNVLRLTRDYMGPHALQNVWLTSLGLENKGPIDTTNLPGETTWDYFRYYAPVQSGHDQSPASLIVDNGGAPYYSETGTWDLDVESNGRRTVFGFEDKDVRRSIDAAATATWAPNVPSAQTYEAFVWIPSRQKTGHTAATYVVDHDGGQTQVVIDQSTAGQQWKSLGVYTFSPSHRSVTLSAGAGGVGTLRADAMKLVQTVLVDNGSSGFTSAGTWVTSWLKGWRESDALYATESDSSARWTPAVTQAGEYDVYVWIPDVDMLSSSATYTVNHNGGVATEALDPNSRPGGWSKLGSYDFATGTGGYIDLAKPSGGSGILRADAIKLVPSGPSSVPATPSDLTATISATSAVGDDRVLNAQWQPVTGAAGYHVYLDGQRLTWQPVRRPSFSFYEMLAGETHDISVTSVSRMGEESAPTFAVPVTAPADVTAPDAPINVSAEIIDKKVVLRWTQNPEIDLGGYHVYKNGEKQTTVEPFAGPNHTTAAEKAGFVIGDLTNGESYTFEVSAIDHVGNESARTALVATPEPIKVVGYEDSGYSEATGGGWANTWLPGWTGTQTRSTNTANASVTWTPDLEKNGIYDLFVYVPNHASSTPNAQYTITSASGSAMVVVDQRPVDGWVPLGRHEFTAGTAGSITVTNPTGGYLRANVAKFAPINSVVDVGDAPKYQEASGTWTTSGVDGWLGGDSRVSGTVGATASWTPDLRAAGTHDVYVWIPNHPTSTSHARYTVNHADGTNSFDHDQRSGGNKWVFLGRFDFAAGTVSSVTVTNAAGSYLRTSGAKFIPVRGVIFNAGVGPAYVSDGTTATTGTWLGSGIGGFEGSRSEYSNSAGATYKWSTPVAKTGTYEIQVYNIQHTSSDTAAQFTVNGAAAATVNQQSTASGWVSIGSFTLASGQEHTITATRSSGSLRVNAVRVVWVGT